MRAAGQSVWEALGGSGEPAPPLVGETRTDVVVIGGGILGLSLALHLRMAGVAVTVLEAGRIGFGASGHSTGFVVPSLRTGLGPAETRARLGDAGDRLTAFVGASADRIFGLIDRFGIACSAERVGWLQPAHTDAMARVLAARAAEWRNMGRAVECLDAAETTRRTGITGYHGCLYDPDGGQVDPLAYARGLAHVATGSGASLHEDARVVSLQRLGGRWIAATKIGLISADRVFLATNALGELLQPLLAASLVPVVIHQAATQVLPPAFRAAILPAGAPVADTRRHTFAARWTPDGRLLGGGLVAPGPRAEHRAGRSFTRRFGQFFPQAPPLQAAYVWRGVIAKTSDDLPRFFEIAPGLDAAIGCNGRGIALTTALGSAIAERYAGWGDFPLPVGAPHAIAGRALARRGPALWLAWSSFRDWLETGRA